MISRRNCLQVLAAAIAPVTAKAAWPEKSLRIVVPYAAGGFTDILARMLATGMAEKLGQPVIVENKPGASTMLGADLVAKSQADGYTLLMATTSTLSTNPLVFKKMPFKPGDLKPVALAGLTPFVLVAHPSVQAKDSAELMSLARANPGKLNFAMLGTGSSTHFVDEMYRRMTGVDIPDVPYKGAGPATNDLLAGHVQLNFDAIATAIPRIQSGALKGIGISSDTRSPLLPSLPTFKESGLPDMVAYSWYGLVAPAGTPTPVVERLNKLVNDLLNSPEIKERLMTNGATAPQLSATQFGALIDDHTRRWERIIKPLNLQLD